MAGRKISHILRNYKKIMAARKKLEDKATIEVLEKERKGSLTFNGLYRGAVSDEPSAERNL